MNWKSTNSSNKDSRLPRVAFSRHFEIESILLGRCRYSSESDALKRIERVCQLFESSKTLKDTYGVPAVIWIKGLASKERTNSGFLGEYVKLEVQKDLHEVPWIVVATPILDIPLNKHPQKGLIRENRGKNQCPPHYHWFRKKIDSGYKYASRSAALTDFYLLQSEFPENAKVGDGSLTVHFWVDKNSKDENRASDGDSKRKAVRYILQIHPHLRKDGSVEYVTIDCEPLVVVDDGRYPRLPDYQSRLASRLVRQIAIDVLSQSSPS